MERRDFLQRIGGAAAARMVCGLPLGVSDWRGRWRLAPDATLRISSVTLEIAPGHVIRTTGYNGSVPGPLIRLSAGRSITIEVHNDTSSPELVHWHGLSVPGTVGRSCRGGHAAHQTAPDPAVPVRAWSIGHAVVSYARLSGSRSRARDVYRTVWVSLRRAARRSSSLRRRGLPRTPWMGGISGHGGRRRGHARRHL